MNGYYDIEGGVGVGQCRRIPLLNLNAASLDGSRIARLLYHDG